MRSTRLSTINKVLLFGTLIFLILFYGQFIIVPIMFSTLLAMLLAPLARFLEKNKVNRLFSSIICTLVILLSFLFLFSLIIAEVLTLADDFPLIQSKFKNMVQDIQNKVHLWFNIPPEKQIIFLDQQASNLMNYAAEAITEFLGRLTSSLGSALLILALSFLFLMQRDRYEKFIINLYENPENTKRVLRQISKVAQKYLIGRFISIIILAIIYTIGFLITGIKNPILLAAFAAFLSIIPYIGTFIGGLLPFLVTIITEPHWIPAIWVIVIIIFGQLFDDYYIEPYIVGGKVDLYPAPSLIILIVGGYVWGLSGLILSIPMLAIVKIIFDHIESLKTYTLIIGGNRERKNKV